MKLIEKLISEKSVIVPCNAVNMFYRTALEMGLHVCGGELYSNGDRVFYLD